MKENIFSTEIPEKVFVIDRAIVTVGFANDVEAVNQYAAVFYVSMKRLALVVQSDV